MYCPECGETKLEEHMTKEGTVVDLCSSCSGIWFDRGNLFDFTDQTRRLQELIEKSDVEDGPGSRDCPRCREPLHRMTVPEDGPVVDKCRICGGYWFDRDELDELKTLERPAIQIRKDGGAKPVPSTGAGEERARSDPDQARERWEELSDVARGVSPLPSLAFRSMSVLFVLYGVLTLFLVLSVEFGLFGPIVALTIAVCVGLGQYIFSPWIMDWILPWIRHLNWVDRVHLPDHLDRFIERVCDEQGMSYPKMGIIADGSPNAFTYGHHPNNARIVITRGLIDMLDQDELEAVVAHEIGHAKHWDMAVMTAANLVPLLMYLLFRFLIQFRNKAKLFGVLAYVVYVISEFFVLFLSRLREYYADRFAGRVTKNPSALSRALVRIGYGLAARKSDSEEDDEGGKRMRALQSLGIFDQESANALAISSGGAPAATVTEGEERGIDKRTLKGAMKWDLWNPWGKYYELHSTHPLVAHRLQHLASQSASMNQEPFIVFDLEKPESYWDEFFVDFLVHIAPVLIGMVSIIGSILLAYFASQPSWVGTGLLITGILYFGKTLFSYPGGVFPNRNVASCLNHVKVSAVRGVPVTLQGTVVGRGVPGLVWSEDFVLQDDSGIIFLDYRQPLRIWEFFFGLLRGEEMKNKEVTIRGWYRRSPVPFVELYEMDVDGGTKGCYVYHMKLGFSVLLAVVGVLWFLYFFAIGF